jgi:DNA polymerase III subunit gamma/tau
MARKKKITPNAEASAALEPSQPLASEPASSNAEALVSPSAPSSAAATSSAPAGGEKTANNDTGAKQYVVLARKYRPQTFDDLIGQDAMVTTLRNAFATDRIAQGYMLTGVRGVGKTTTARILARALNYTRDGLEKPSIEMPVFGRHCAEIMESRHPDVLELDAASNTGVDNIREIIESARYKPLVARTKVFIVDEVHMLSKGAFNALLKILEEPPAHVKFIFATTEVRKVPVTVLSRCQRFDLRRVDAGVLAAHFKKIAADEGATADDDALALIARAAEGSVRDGLSILDQAITMGAGKVDAATVRAMLGLADRGRIFDLLEQLFGGAAGEALDAFGKLHRDGADPVQVLADLAEAVHVLARVKIAGTQVANNGLSSDEQRRAATLAGRLSLAIVSRAWQLLLKGFDEAARAPDPLAAAEMVLIRLAFTADLPTPDEIIRSLTGPAGGGSSARAATSSGAQASIARLPLDLLAAQSSSNSAQPAAQGGGTHVETGTAVLPALRSFEDVVKLVGQRRDARLKVHLEEHASLVKFDPAGSLELHLLPAAPKEIANELREKLNQWTGQRWSVAVSDTPGEPPLGELQRAREAAELGKIKTHPAVAAVLQEFPGARITRVLPLQRKTDDSATG